MDIVTVFCDIDSFCQCFLATRPPAIEAHFRRKRKRPCALTLSEILTILVYFHASHDRTFKHFYLDHLLGQRQAEFPHLLSYTRFVELIPSALLPFCAYLQTRKGACTGLQLIDSLPFRVCRNRRIHSRKVFAGLARRGQSSMGWFYGFQLHLVINQQGEALGVTLTPGQVDDRRPVRKLARSLRGKRFGDRGYLGRELFDD